MILVRRLDLLFERLYFFLLFTALFPEPSHRRPRHKSAEQETDGDCAEHRHVHRKRHRGAERVECEFGCLRVIESEGDRAYDKGQRQKPGQKREKKILYKFLLA